MDGWSSEDRGILNASGPILHLVNQYGQKVAWCGARVNGRAGASTRSNDYCSECSDMRYRRELGSE